MLADPVVPLIASTVEPALPAFALRAGKGGRPCRMSNPRETDLHTVRAALSLLNLLQVGGTLSRCALSTAATSQLLLVRYTIGMYLRMALWPLGFPLS